MVRMFLVLALAVASIGATSAQELVDGKTAEDGICGGFVGFICPDNEWCDFPSEAACGIGDQTGKCRPRPEICTREFMPVCACNGETYSNACQAAAAGFDVAYVGVCRPGSAE